MGPACAGHQRCCGTPSGRLMTVITPGGPSRRSLRDRVRAGRATTPEWRPCWTWGATGVVESLLRLAARLTPLHERIAVLNARVRCCAVHTGCRMHQHGVSDRRAYSSRAAPLLARARSDLVSARGTGARGPSNSWCGDDSHQQHSRAGHASAQVLLLAHTMLHHPRAWPRQESALGLLISMRKLLQTDWVRATRRPASDPWMPLLLGNPPR